MGLFVFWIPCRHHVGILGQHQSTSIHAPVLGFREQQQLRKSQGRRTTCLGSGQLGVSRVALSRMINGRAAISADMAIRLALAAGLASNAHKNRLPT